MPEKALVSRYLKDIEWDTLLARKQAANRVIEISYPAARYLEFNLLPVEPEINEHPDMAFVAIFHDITQQTTRAREVMESERVHLMTLLSAGVAHELGNPLNNLNIHLQLMEREAMKCPSAIKARLQGSLETLSEELNRMDTIIREFLKAIRPTRPDFNLVDIRLLIVDTFKLLERELDDRAIKTEVSAKAEDELATAVDVGQMKQVFYNLIKNSLHALPNGGTILAEIKREGDLLRIDFRDDGIGIELEDISKVMQPYYTTKEKGSGLGLMIIQRIVSEHGGRIELESEKGIGTTVRIYLPLGVPQIHLLKDSPLNAE
ncbi:MAG: ATP-binding protein [Verrucomicrobiota bacterium]